MKRSQLFTAGIVIAVFLGVGTGYIVAAASRPVTIMPLETTTEDGGQVQTADVAVKVGQVFGGTDTKTFKDSAEGVVVAGGIGGEGSHHIVRPGGESQSVYLTSSVVDLKLFENHKVKVFGETFKAQKAGWLMDVGRAEVLELNAPLPDWAQKKAATNEGNE